MNSNQLTSDELAIHMGNLDVYIAEKKYSEITEEFPDKEKYPLYYQASRHEFTIGPGEMLFIPAGWFHFVFSEDSCPETSLNYAINYWYYPENDWVEENPSFLLPRKDTHSLPYIDPRDVCGNKIMNVTRSNLNGLFPSARVFHKFNGKCYFEQMTYDQFYESKNPNYYIIQVANTDVLNKHAPKYTKDLWNSSAWINFGNARSLIHYDEYDNWLCQVKGTKRVVLFPHQERDMLYMFNPIPLYIANLTQMAKDSNTQYIAYGKKILKPEFYDKWSKIQGLLQNDDILAIYKSEVMKYILNNLRSVGLDIPEPPIPEKFEIVETRAFGVYNKQQEKYPISCFLILEGTGKIQIKGLRTLPLEGGDVVIFPTHFTYPYCIEGYLKFLVPV